MNRRKFLKTSAGALSASSLGGMAAALSGFNAQAADTAGYKALVCVFLLGGNDNHDTLIPYDAASYGRYARIRQSLLTQYAGRRDRGKLLPLTPDNGGKFGGRQFALPPEMTGLQALFNQGNAAIVGNVGPLLQATNRSEFELESVTLPPSLFSHNDQQAVWMSSSPEGAQQGWGGAFVDAVRSNNSQPEFSAITSGGNDLFLTGQRTAPYQIGREGAQQIRATESAYSSRQEALLQAHFRSAGFSSDHLIRQDMANLMRAAYDTNQKYNQALNSAAALNTTFPNGELSSQLKAVARTIAMRDSLSVNRQVFIVGMGGYDTHDQQASALPRLHGQLDSALTAFYMAMNELGLSNNVTLFTASDFGRTLAINGDGTDHGWGAHHFVVGGAVKGRNIYGDVPVADFNHAQDAGGGRLIPTTSVEQFAAPLGSWFGLNETELQTALPNLGNFGGRPAFI
ncbi:MAG: DUF1501 domain-containing protein [Thiolinea sp.]